MFDAVAYGAYRTGKRRTGRPQSAASGPEGAGRRPRMSSEPQGHVRRLLVVLGDQLNADSTLLTDLDPERDLVWMCEAAAEATHVPSHKARTVLFLSAMRHFRDALARGRRAAALPRPRRARTGPSPRPWPPTWRR
jgi:hypothetical protein